MHIQSRLYLTDSYAYGVVRWALGGRLYGVYTIRNTRGACVLVWCTCAGYIRLDHPIDLPVVRSYSYSYHISVMIMAIDRL